MSFSSPDELFNTVEFLKEKDSFNVPQTRSGSAGFVSLRDHLIAQGLREFTDEELALIAAEELTYEPEDELICDPFFASVLNPDREIQIGDFIYRYVDEGMIVYDASYLGRFEELEFPPIHLDTLRMIHGDRITISDKADFVKIDYATSVVQADFNDHTSGNDGDSGPSGDGDKTPNENPDTSDDNDDTSNDNSGSSGEVSGGLPGFPWEVNKNDEDDMGAVFLNNGSLILSDGIEIKKDKIKKTTFKQGNGDANWFQEFISELFGTNVTLENNFDNKHRMKLRMYCQDYYIYRAIGMTVRMQKKVLGIWWRKKAQEFRYGWTAIEVEYKHNATQFVEPPKMPDGTYQREKYPAIAKNFPYANDKIVLFNVGNYNFTTGDVDKLYNSAMRSVANYQTEWYKNHPEYIKNPRGVYTAYDDDRTIRIVYPQGEDVAYNDGREEVKWELEGLSGQVVISLYNRLGGGGWQMGSINFTKTTETTVKRGRIYAAVKFNNTWRACSIQTE